MAELVTDIDFAVGRFPDLHEILSDFRATQPAVRVRFFGEPAWLLTRYEDVVSAFGDNDTFPSQAAYSLFAEPAQGRTIQCMEGDEHRRNRKLVLAAFRPGAVAGYVDSLIRPAAEELVDRFAHRREAELVAEFTRQFPFTVITRLLGIPEDAHADFHRWANALFDFPRNPAGALRAKDEFTTYLAPVVDRRRRDPGDDLISALATAAIDGERLTDEEIFSFVRLLFPAGADTAYLGLGSLLFALLTHPEALEAARSDPEYRRRAVEETLRWEGPVALQPRRSAAPSRFGDVEIPPQSWMLFGITAANRDPDVFGYPDRFDPDRELPRPVVTFGHGVHFCLGSHLARREMTVALDVLLERLPGLRLTNAGAVRIEGAVLRGPNVLPVTFGATYRA